MWTDSSAAAGFPARRRRLEIDLPATLALGVRAPVPTRLRNISPVGAFADCDEALPIGAQVTLFTPALGSLSAQVRWALGGRIGLLFTEALGAEARAAIAELADAPPPAEARAA